MHPRPNANQFIDAQFLYFQLHVYNIDGQILILLGNDLLLLPNSCDRSGLSSLLGVRIEEHSEAAGGPEKALTWSTTGLVRILLPRRKSFTVYSVGSLMLKVQ